MLQNEWSKSLNIEYPIIQAPMAGGITTPQLVAAVSNAGGLGMIGAGYLNPDQTRQLIREVKALTRKPFGINLFIPEQCVANEEQIRKANERLQKYREDLNIRSETPILHNKSGYEEQVNIILEEEVPVCSFTFGLPSEDVVTKLKSAGIYLMGTATTVTESILVEQLGMDVVVAQGSEAGGHRGTFLEKPEMSLIGLMSLVPQMVDQVNLPVIAAGGIMDERGLMAALCLGAKGVQMGTAFLTCKESGAHELYKKAIMNVPEDETVLTTVFSGKHARGINNQFIKEMSKYESELLGYPFQNTLTKEIRKAAGEQNKPNFMSLWSGQSPRLSKNLTAAELIQQIVDRCKNIGDSMK
ncbi:NAD(P)H-dependent flavin oxidoreductase [Heyndrickxia sp. NPDC080065]|uniref:NAD(P)H-dependent flavin oxidoreductase n=1 Tax=Heyndrickxia sp. NPDC080065 TaxID=3390568 RepID=UPI003D011EE2